MVQDGYERAAADGVDVWKRRWENHKYYWGKGKHSISYGRRHRLESRKKMSLAAANRSLEYRQKMSKAKCGKGNPMYQKDFTSEHRERLSLAHKGKHHNTPERLKKLQEGLRRPETREKLRRAMLGKNNPNYGKHTWNYGGHLSEETKQKLRQANIGKHPTLQTREKLRLAKSGKNNPYFGKHHTLEVREKIRQGNIQYRKKFPEFMSGKNHPMYGKNHTIETREKIRQANIRMGNRPPSFKGKRHTAETKKKMSLAMCGEKNPNYGKYGKNNPLYRRQLSEENKAKISAGLKRYFANKKSNRSHGK